MEIDRDVSAHLRSEDGGLADGIQIRGVGIGNTRSVEPEVEEDVNLQRKQRLYAVQGQPDSYTAGYMYLALERLPSTYQAGRWGSTSFKDRHLRYTAGIARGAVAVSKSSAVCIWLSENAVFRDPADVGRSRGLAAGNALLDQPDCNLAWAAPILSLDARVSRWISGTQVGVVSAAKRFELERPGVPAALRAYESDRVQKKTYYN